VVDHLDLLAADPGAGDEDGGVLAAQFKLFFADALDSREAQELVSAIKQRSEERVATLRAIEPTAKAIEEEGNVYPLLTLRMGIAHHQAMIDVCQDFEQPPGPARPERSGEATQKNRH